MIYLNLDFYKFEELSKKVQRKLILEFKKYDSGNFSFIEKAYWAQHLIDKYVARLENAGFCNVEILYIDTHSLEIPKISTVSLYHEIKSLNKVIKAIIPELTEDERKSYLLQWKKLAKDNGFELSELIYLDSPETNKFSKLVRNYVRKEFYKMTNEMKSLRKTLLSDDNIITNWFMGNIKDSWYYSDGTCVFDSKLSGMLSGKNI